MHTFQHEIDILPGNVPRLVLRGALDLSAVGWLEEIVDEMLAWKSDRILLDVSGVTFISSGAIGVLIAAAEEYRRRGGRIYIVNPSKPILHVFTLCALTECATCVTCEEEALGVCA